MLLATQYLALVRASIWPFIHADAILFAIHVLSREFPAVIEYEGSLTMHPAFFCVIHLTSHSMASRGMVRSVLLYSRKHIHTDNQCLYCMTHICCLVWLVIPQFLFCIQTLFGATLLRHIIQSTSFFNFFR